MTFSDTLFLIQAKQITSVTFACSLNCMRENFRNSMQIDQHSDGIKNCAFFRFGPNNNQNSLLIGHTTTWWNLLLVHHNISSNPNQIDRCDSSSGPWLGPNISQAKSFGLNEEVRQLKPS